MPRSIDDARTWAAAGSLYAVLDSCDTPAVLDRVRALGDEFAVSLYRGSAEENYDTFAPYLVSADADTLEWIVATLWTEHWGILVRSPIDLPALRTHFRKFLMVKSPTGDPWYFRYYDPRVLAGFLPACTEAELSDFFGPVEVFATTAAGGDGLVTFSRGGER